MLNILLDAKINVLLDTKPEAAGLTEVPPQQLVLLDLQATLQQLHRLLSPHRHVARNLLITPNAERPHSVPRCNIITPSVSAPSTQTANHTCISGLRKITLGEHR